MRTGPVVVNIESPLAEVQAGLSLHYAQYQVEPADGFVDFHVSVERPRSMRRWTRPQVSFLLDGTAPAMPLDGDEGFAVLERGLTWCISNHCHQYLIVRAAVLERDGRALILPAPEGSGKSTLCAALAFGGGWRLLSDELALIEPATGQVVALPRPLRLNCDSIDLVRRFAPDAVFSATGCAPGNGEATHARVPADGLLRADEPAQAAWVVLPHYLAGAATRLEPLSRAHGFMALVDNAINYHVHGRTGFAAFGALIDRSTCHDFSYSSLPEAVTAFDRLAKLA